MKPELMACAAACALGLVAPATARLTEIRVTLVEPFADGTSFGAGGAYERVKGTFRGELDPADSRNAMIVNLDKAPRNAAGRVEYEADFFMLRPAGAEGGSRKMLYDVTNRGRKQGLARLADARPAPLAVANDPRSAEHVGNAFPLRLGYTVLWSGWDPDAPRANHGMTLSRVVATDNGMPIVRVIRDEIVPQTRDRSGPEDGKVVPRATLRLTHEAANLDPAQARLTVRRRQADPRREIPADGWAYVNSREIRLLPSGTLPEPGAIYEFHYAAMNPAVLGIGLAATRDLISFLKHESHDSRGNASPLRARPQLALGYGSSQSGRFLRDFVREGFNQDEAARKVFDGVLAHTAGAGGVFLNQEFAQPVRTRTQHEDHAFPENAFPFSTARMTDPVTGKTGAVLRNDGFDPLWIETNTSAEHWQKAASLLVTDPLGDRDMELPTHARSYLITGAQHGGTAWMQSTPGPCANPRNPHSPNPALRALLVALDEWVSTGTPPPASRTPRLKDNTLVAVERLQFPAIPGVAVARRVNELGVLKDWVKPDMDMSKPYRVLVPQVDADGNETSGVLLPGIAVPLGTHTGWNLYRAPFPEGELCDRDGTYVPFAATRAEREAKGDPRRSLEERYGDHDGYVRRVERAAAKLVAERLLLGEDTALILLTARSEEVARRFAPSQRLVAD